MIAALIALGILAMFLSFLSLPRLADRLPRKWQTKVIPLLNILGAILGMVLSETRTSWGQSTLRLLSRLLGLYGMRCVVCLCVIGFGILAHFWKQKNQRTYGMSEVLFGIVAGTFITFTLAADKSFLSQWVALGGAAYIIARGLNNVADAKAKLAKLASA